MKKVLLMYALYTQQANEKVLQLLDKLSPEERNRDRKSYYKSLTGLAQHNIGSILFFYLFLQTRYIPRALSALGVFASFVTLLTSLANLIFPAYASIIQFGWGPIFIAEIVTGIWLLSQGVPSEISPVS